MPFLAQIGFFPIFATLAHWNYFDLDRKQKVTFLTARGILAVQGIAMRSRHDKTTELKKFKHFHEVFMRFSWGFHDVFMRFSWGFHEVSVRFPWGFHEVFMRLPWGFHEVFMRFSWVVKSFQEDYLSIFKEWGFFENLKRLRGHPHMASDDFRSFLTYLPSLIRYHQMEADLPTYPNIWRQIFTAFNPRLGLNRQTWNSTKKFQILCFVCVW